VRDGFSFDVLESRSMLHGFNAVSIALNGTVLEIIADKHANVIEITKGPSDRIVLQIDGEADPTNPLGYPLADVQKIRIDAGAGNDRVTVDSDLDVSTEILGGKGNDTLVGGSGGDTIDGGVGVDSISGGDGDDWLLGGTKNDHLVGGDDDDVINGGTGNDVLDGGAGDDMLQNDLGRDTVTGGAGTDLFAPRGRAGTRTDFSPLEDIDAGTPVTIGSFTDSALLGIRTDLQPGAPDITDRHHTNGPVDYESLGFTNPPTYGPHHVRFARNNDKGAPVQPTGVFLTELDDADLVHNLEHGHVWLSYDPGLLNAGDIAKLRALVTAFGGSRQGILVTPRAANDDPIALVSWAHLQTLSSFELDTLAQFIITNRGHAPEGFLTP
jgi:hypothetical protein